MYYESVDAYVPLVMWKLIGPLVDLTKSQDCFCLWYNLEWGSRWIRNNVLMKGRVPCITSQCRHVPKLANTMSVYATVNFTAIYIYHEHQDAFLLVRDKPKLDGCVRL